MWCLIDRLNTQCAACFVDWKKNCIAWELWVKFYLGQNEDYSLGNSVSDRSEEMLWRARGGGARSGYMWFWWRGIYTVRDTFWQRLAASPEKVTASHEEQMSPLIILVFIYMWEDARIWAHKIWKHPYEGMFFQVFPEHTVPHSWSPPSTPFRLCCRSASTAAHDLIFVEVDGKWQIFFGIVYAAFFFIELILRSV